MKRHAVLLVLLVSLIAVVPILADNSVYCDTFPVSTTQTGQVPPYGDPVENFNVVDPGDYHKIIVNSDCYIGPSAHVTGGIIEPDSTPYSIIVDPQATVSGKIIERGDGDIRMTVGGGLFFNGTIKEEGPGYVWIWVDGVFRGRVEENDEGLLTVQVFGGPPSGGPGTFNGTAVEKDSGDATLRIDDEPPPTGDYNGNFREEGEGDCYIYQPSTGNITCK